MALSCTLVQLMWKMKRDGSLGWINSRSTSVRHWQKRFFQLLEWQLGARMLVQAGQSERQCTGISEMGMCYWSIARWAKSLTARFAWTSQWGHVTILNSLLRTGRMCMYPLNWYGSLERRYLGRCVNVSICSCDPFSNIW